MSIFYVWSKAKTNHKCNKIIFKIYLQVLRIKNYLNWIFINNLLLVLLFSYRIHSNWKNIKIQIKKL
jgi:hypothetical protein